VASIVEPRVLGYEEARERVLDGVRPMPGEIVPLAEARGRALRESIRAPHPLPPFRNSSMDGYATRSDDLAGASRERPVELPVVEVLPAGRIASRALRAREAMRIMTGAALPEGADAVVPFEDSERIGGPGEGAPPGHPDPLERARFVRPMRPGENVREAGADLAAGDLALEEGRDLSPHDLALLAGLGVARLRVGPRPRAAIVSTGDELLPIEEPLRPGTIRDSNLPLLTALLEEAGCEVVSAVRVPDNPARVAARIREGLGEADVVLSIGGVSAGDFDPVKTGLGELSEIELWRVAMKPGRPQAFGRPGGRLFFGLPGNPASVACVFEALVRPALRRLQGFASLDRPRIRVRAAEAIESRAGRTDFVRAVLEQRSDAWWATPAGAQISGHLTPQARAHALLIVPEPVTRLAPGDPADALVLRWPEPGPA